MAFTILDATSENLSNQSLPPALIPLNYSLGTGSKWIYCNYPEGITSDCFGDTNLGNKFLNQATVKSGTSQIFYSYIDSNRLGPYNFGIQVYNPNKSSITFQKLYSGHRDSSKGGWTQAIGGSWVDFFRSTSSRGITIPSGKVYWLQTKIIPKGSFFTGNIRFHVSGSAVITVYVYQSLSKIDGTATAYPKSDVRGMYSGVGNGYYFTADTITLNASELSSGKYFKMTYPSGLSSVKINSVNKTSDLIPLTLAYNGVTISPPKGNLGNWCAQYYYPFRFVNDTNSPKTFTAYVRTDVGGNIDNWPIIKSGAQCKYACLNASKNNSWKWLSQPVNAHAAVSGDIQFILGTNSCAKASMIFKVK